MHHDAIEKHVNKRLEYSSATIFLIPTGHKIGQKSVQIIVLLRGDVIKRTTGPEACTGTNPSLNSESTALIFCCFGNEAYHLLLFTILNTRKGL